MKKIYLSLFFSFLFVSFYAQEVSKTPSVSTLPNHVGKVSHQFKVKGCTTVIVMKNGVDEIILIPKNPLPKNLDKDGLEIKFDYRLLRMPNPQGCEKGMPVEISNCSKK